MARYIDEALANARLKEICEDTSTAYGIEYGGRAEKFARLTESIPTAKVAEVIYAKWEISSDGYYPYCSHCKSEPENGVRSKYCPECGARMDGGAK